MLRVYPNLDIQYRALTRLRHHNFDIRFANEPQSGTPLRQNLHGSGLFGLKQTHNVEMVSTAHTHTVYSKSAHTHTVYSKYSVVTSNVMYISVLSKLVQIFL